jgi:predicted acyltransferase
VHPSPTDPPPLLQPARPPAARRRVAALDAFRGLTIAAMLVVNNPGSWEHVYAPLRHAAWHGCTPTDLVFPFFLFAVGLSMAYSSRLEPGLAHEAGALGRVHLAVVRRAAVLVALGLALNLVSVLLRSPVDLSRWRLPGVLQRIGLCSLATSLIALHVPRRGQYALGAAILVGYWALLTLVPVPGHPGAAERLTAPGNLVAWVDRLVLGEGHMYRGLGVAHDPEGLLSTLPAVVTTLAGLWTGRWLRAGGAAGARGVGTVGALALAGVACVGAGWAWDAAGLPLNKSLWTSSYVLFTAGWALLVLSGCWLATEVLGARPDGWRRLRAGARPLEALGANAILAFVGSGLLARALGAVTVEGGRGPVTLPGAAYAWLVGTGLRPVDASLAYALVTLGCWWAVLWALWKRGWLWKV